MNNRLRPCRRVKGLFCRECNVLVKCGPEIETISISQQADKLMQIADATSGPKGYGHSPAFEEELRSIILYWTRHDRIGNQRHWIEKLNKERISLESSEMAYFDKWVEDLENGRA